MLFHLRSLPLCLHTIRCAVLCCALSSALWGMLTFATTAAGRQPGKRRLQVFSNVTRSRAARPRRTALSVYHRGYKDIKCVPDKGSRNTASPHASALLRRCSSAIAISSGHDVSSNSASIHRPFYRWKREDGCMCAHVRLPMWQQNKYCTMAYIY